MYPYLPILFNILCMCAQSSLTLCDPMDCSPPGISVHGISSQENWNGLAFPTPGDLPNPGIEPTSLAFPALADRFFTTMPPGKPHSILYGMFYPVWNTWSETVFTDSVVVYVENWMPSAIYLYWSVSLARLQDIRLSCKN